VIDYPFGTANEEAIPASGGTFTFVIDSICTFIETETLTNNCTLNVTFNPHIEDGALLHIQCTTDATETFTFGTGIDAPTVTGIAGKTWAQTFVLSEGIFYPVAEKSFTESTCPSITLGPLSWGLGNQYFLVGQLGASVDALISNGTAPFTPSVTAGSLPTGMSVSVVSFFGNNYIRISGSPTTFDSYTFTIGGTDANGCAITPKVYTIEVWVQKSVTPGAIAADDITEFPVTVSEISGVYGTTAKLAKIDFDIDFADLDGYIGCYIYSPDTSPADCLFPQAWDSVGMAMTGADLTGCVINNNSLGTFPNTVTGTAPYTGNWNDLNGGLIDPYFDTNFTGDTMNGTWRVHFETVTYAGSVTSIKLYFKPL